MKDLERVRESETVDRKKEGEGEEEEDEAAWTSKSFGTSRMIRAKNP